MGDGAAVRVAVGKGVGVGEAKNRGIGMDSLQEVTSSARPTTTGRICLATLTRRLARSGCIFIPLHI